MPETSHSGRQSRGVEPKVREVSLEPKMMAAQRFFRYLNWQPIGRWPHFPSGSHSMTVSSPFPGIVKCNQYQLGIMTLMDPYFIH